MYLVPSLAGTRHQRTLKNFRDFTLGVGVTERKPYVL